MVLFEKLLELNLIPYYYFNSQGELVGFDVDMAQELAQELSVTIEFVPFTYETLDLALEKDYFDLAMSGIPGTVYRSEVSRFSDPYLNVTRALLVPDYRDREFTNLKSINRIQSLRIGLVEGGLTQGSKARDSFLKKLKLYIPNAEIVFIQSPRDFLEGKGKGKDVDVLLIDAESGSAWTLLYPRFQVVNPFPDKIATPLVYPFYGEGDEQIDEFMDHWVEVKKLDGTIERLYEYWILGQGSEQKEPRWSIIRNVLHLVD